MQTRIKHFLYHLRHLIIKVPLNGPIHVIQNKLESNQVTGIMYSLEEIQSFL